MTNGNWKLNFINEEYDILKNQFEKNVKIDDKLNDLFKELKDINNKLWDIENEKRLCENQKYLELHHLLGLYHLKIHV